MPDPSSRPSPGTLRPWRRLLSALTRKSTPPGGVSDRAFTAEEVAPAPPLAPGEVLVDVVEVRPPFATVRLIRDPGRGTHRYEVVEPRLREEEAAALAAVKDIFLRTLDVDLAALDAAGASAYLASSTDLILARERIALDPLERARVLYFVERDFLGFGPIDAVMRDPDIEDVSCDGPGLPLFAYHRRVGSLRTNLVIHSEDALDGFVMRLVQSAGKHISVAEPLVDATLPDGSRLQASLSRAVTTRGSTFTIRKFREDPFTPPDLVGLGTASPEMLAWFWLAFEHGASALMCGGTASGKTTTLNALSLFIPAEKKIVSIEDTREIRLLHENWIPGVTRGGVTQDALGERRAGDVGMFDLLKAALRQRPEYLLVGEVRGREALVLFQAMATGHTVYSTMHADSAASAVYRLESKPLEVPRMMLSALDIITIQAEARVEGKRVRRIREVVEITGIDPKTGDILTNQVFAWDAARSRFRYAGSSHLLARIASETNVSEEHLERELDRRSRLIAGMHARGIRDIAGVARLLGLYLMDPERALAEVAPVEAEPRPASREVRTL